MIKKIMFFVFCTMMTSFSMAKTLLINGEEIVIGPITTVGSGCPPGTVIPVANDDNTQIAILFSAYEAVTNAEFPALMTNCSVAIPLSVGPGFSVGILDIDWRGSILASAGSFINFHREFFFSGAAGPVRDTNWFGFDFENFNINDNPGFVHYSGCDGGSLIARADTVATVSGANSIFSLRAGDVTAELLLTVEVFPCP
jgi:Domain of unknown function (DUF4360)